MHYENKTHTQTSELVQDTPKKANLKRLIAKFGIIAALTPTAILTAGVVKVATTHSEPTQPYIPTAADFDSLAPEDALIPLQSGTVIITPEANNRLIPMPEPVYMGPIDEPRGSNNQPGK